MRKILLIAIVSFFSILSAESKIGWVYLNNGNVIKGDITTTETKVLIHDETGTELEYPMIEVNRISYTPPVVPAIGKDPTLGDLNEIDKGFWISPQISGSYAMFLKRNWSPWAEFDVNGGYRFSQYLKVGIGVGTRWYLDNSDLRSDNVAVSFPIYATVRGNIIEETYRDVVPYYTFDLGGVVRDGFMWRPGIGLRIGQKRSAFLVGITYTGQTLNYVTKKNRYVSSIGLTIGYEY